MRAAYSVSMRIYPDKEDREGGRDNAPLKVRPPLPRQFQSGKGSPGQAAEDLLI